MRFASALQSERFLVTADVIPPKGTNLSRLAALRGLNGLVDAVNAVDMPSARMRMSPLAVCWHLNEMGLEPILQITCRDRNRLSLQAELLGAHALGIENVLCLTGDDEKRTDHPGVKTVFDLDAIELIKAARCLEKGYDLGGNKLDGAPRFCLGAALDPGKERLDGEIERIERKAEAGVQFFQTQPIFDVKAFSAFLSKVKHLRVPILAGVFLLESAKMARFLNKNIPGIAVPDEVIAQMEEGDNSLAGVELLVRLIRELRELFPAVRGVHIMMHTCRHGEIPAILGRAGLLSCA